MRPQLWVEYEKLVKQYKEEGWGIYDDTSDIEIAVSKRLSARMGRRGVQKSIGAGGKL